MWTDNETGRDFLNFSGVADGVAEIIVQADGNPISVGVSGAWGSGKSSMIELIRSALTSRIEDDNAFVFVEFNAWLYQGYDDARAALLEVIARDLVREAENRKRGVEKAKELLNRVNWFRVAKLTTFSAATLASAVLSGEPPNLEALLSAIVLSETPESSPTEKSKDSQTELRSAISPHQQIHAIRESLEQTLRQLGVTLVVLIDDLDRCLPATAISTLEAIRLFLFLSNTAFVVAADDAMIKHAVRDHFNSVDESVATNYFDKLIQVPIRVPPLGTQEVRAYMMLLFVENSGLTTDDKEAIRIKVCDQLSQSWRGQRVDRAFMEKNAQ